MPSLCRSSPERLLAVLDAWSGSDVCFARSDCRYGRVCFVVRHSDLVWKTYSTGLHLSRENGAGGARMLVGLYRLLKQLNRTWAMHTAGFTLPDAEFGSLVGGKVFPGALLDRRPQCPWSDDFPDLDYWNQRTRGRLEPHGPEFLDAQSIVRSIPPITHSTRRAWG